MRVSHPCRAVLCVLFFVEFRFCFCFSANFYMFFTYSSTVILCACRCFQFFLYAFVFSSVLFCFFSFLFVQFFKIMLSIVCSICVVDMACLCSPFLFRTLNRISHRWWEFKYETIRCDRQRKGESERGDSAKFKSKYGKIVCHYDYSIVLWHAIFQLGSDWTSTDVDWHLAGFYDSEDKMKYSLLWHFEIVPNNRPNDRPNTPIRYVWPLYRFRYKQ